MPTNTGRWKKKTSNFWKILWKQLQDFFQNTSIHGIQYLAKSLPTLEKVLWLFSIILSIVVCGYLIRSSWRLRTTNPVFLAMDKTQQAIWEIPFPAVTVCPTLKIKRTNRNHENFESATRLLCEEHVEESSNISEIIDFIEKNSPNVSDIFIIDGNQTSIRFGPVTRRPIVPKRILTSDGLCYSFNMLPGEDLFADNTFHRSRDYLNYSERVQWNEDGYETNEVDAYPRRALGPDADGGLLLVLKNQPEPETEEDVISSGPCSYVQGFQIKVHNPAVFPNTEVGYYVAAETHAQISVFPRRTLSNEGIAAYSPNQRQCYRQGEKKLQFFDTYTQHNCQEECVANTTHSCCECVDFHMPRLSSTQVCHRQEQRECARHALERTLVGTSNLEYEGECRNETVACDCLPLCTRVEYESHVSQARVSGPRLKHVIKHLGLDVEPGYNYTVVEIFYLNSHFVPYRRIEQYGTIEFLSNIGGQLGLCLGMSALSVLELLYWLLVRPLWCCRSARKTPVDVESVHLEST